MLAGLFALGFGRRAWPWVLAGTLLFAGWDEWHQFALPGRSPGADDWLADALPRNDGCGVCHDFQKSQKSRKTMKPSVALDRKRAAVREAAGRFRTANPRIFGSVLHGTDQDGSDLDLLVDALPCATLFDLGELQVELESLLGVSVDLLTPGDLPPRFREQVLAEAAPV